VVRTVGPLGNHSFKALVLCHLEGLRGISLNVRAVDQARRWVGQQLS
jgi:hypothetical protein